MASASISTRASHPDYSESMDSGATPKGGWHQMCMGWMAMSRIAIRRSQPSQAFAQRQPPDDTSEMEVVRHVRAINKANTGKLRQGMSEENVLRSVRIKVQLEQRRRARRFIFRPGESKFLHYWDALSVIVLTYTALFTPFEIAFLPSFTTSNAWKSPRFLIARLVDIFFTVDLCLNFCIGHRRFNHTDELQGSFVGLGKWKSGAWVESHYDIARYYLTGWFVFDLITLIPSIFDIIPTLTSSTIGTFADASIIRTFRVLRFVKILRVARAARISERWAARFSLTQSTRTILWCIVRLLVSVHWFACIFALQAALHDSAKHTWRSKSFYDYCDDDVQGWDDAADRQPQPPADVEHDEWCPGLGAGTWYLASFTWSLMIITGTGGTDFYPSSSSNGETIVVLLLTFMGALLWTTILADFCDVATNGNPVALRFRQTLDELNLFISLNALPVEMSRRMREYLYARRSCRAIAQRSKH